MYPSGFTFALKIKEKQEMSKEGKFCTGCKKTSPTYIPLLISANYVLGIFSYSIDILVWCKEHDIIWYEAKNK